MLLRRAPLAAAVLTPAFLSSPETQQTNQTHPLDSVFKSKARALELGRECLRRWGYTRTDELIWVKVEAATRRLTVSGRTGLWLNHTKEHCLVGLKGAAARLNKRVDCDVLVAPVRAVCFVVVVGCFCVGVHFTFCFLHRPPPPTTPT